MSKSLLLKVIPAVTGRQLVRLSLPVPEGFLQPHQTFAASTSGENIVAAARVLTLYPGATDKQRWARRVLVTFPYEFINRQPVHFELRPVETEEVHSLPRLPVDVQIDGQALTISYHSGPVLTALIVAPDLSSHAPRIETIESNPYYLWQRIHFSDPEWPREIEVRADVLGGVAVVAHLRRDLPGDAYAPDFGWDITFNTTSANLMSASTREANADTPVKVKVEQNDSYQLLFHDDAYQLYHPTAPFTHYSRIELQRQGAGEYSYNYRRCTPEDKVPMQQASWRRAEFVVSPASLAPLTATLESPHDARVDWKLWDRLYATGEPLDLAGQPELAQLLEYHHNATVRCMVHGHDWGNVTFYSDERATGEVHGMNRLNHCIPIFEEGYRSNNRRLMEVGVLWCQNFYDQSIWWGPEQTGGTRYNNQRSLDQTPPDDDTSYMWRSNNTVSFCTKGFASFFIAYEQTGDPRMLEALQAQVTYASQYVSAGYEVRNVGIVHDFLLLHRFTGEQEYLNQALRLFQELREVLSAGDLFSQSGHPLLEKPPFIDDDEVGTEHPFVKPYILGYALEGLPELAEYFPEEPKLKEVVRAVADFIAASQDPAGGWRYPHPGSSYLFIDQSIEHAWHLVQAIGLLGAREHYLDAIARTLRQRLLGWRHTGKFLTGLTGWEISSGAIKEQKEIYSLYKYPEDRDFTLDYTRGNPIFGCSSPEGIVYLPKVLALYLKHRSAEYLLAPAIDDEPLGKILARVEYSAPAAL